MPTSQAPGDVQRDARRRPAWRLLLGHVSPYRGSLLAGGLLGLLGGLAALAQPMVAKLVIDTLGRHGSLVAPAALLSGLAVAGALLNTAGMYLLGRAAEGVVLTARQRLIARILRLRVSTLDHLQPGDLLARVTSDTTLLRSVSTYGLVHAVNAMVVLATAVVLMALLDVPLLLVTVAVLAVSVLAALLVVPRIRRATERSQAAVGRIGSVLERALGAMRTIKAAGAEDRQIATIGRAAARAWRRGVEVAGWTALMESSTGLAVQVSFLAVLGVGGARVAGGALPVSSLIAFLLYLVLLTDPISSLVNAVTQLQAGLAAVARMREVHELPVEPPARPSAGRGWSSPWLGAASAEFSGVWFSYRPQEDGAWVHRDLTFQVPAGGTTAIVGSSGAGKSTVFALLERYYQPQWGSVSVDGRDVRRWSLPELRAAIGYVEQDAPVIAGTLRQNLCLAAPDAGGHDLEAVLTLTRLQALVDRLPKGLDTQVGHRGTTLSGGEQQRIAIGRAVLRRPRILLLDEATSQLDALNELALLELIQAVGRTTTVLVVAHRLSTVRGADRIFVMDGGWMRASGTHEELLAGDEVYRRLVATQLLAAA